VVSHPSVVATNQAVFAELVNQGFDVHLVTPATWVNEYAPQAFDAPTDPVLVGRHTKLAVWLKGRPQRHFYRGSITSTIEAIRPDVIYIEEECFSLAAAQWARAAQRLHVPYGLQAWENLDRPLPALVKRLRSFVLRHASFIVARTPAARTMVEHWGTTADVDVVGCPRRSRRTRRVHRRGSGTTR
jgi:hypothetical protein